MPNDSGSGPNFAVLTMSSNMRVLVILGSPRDIYYTLLFKKKKKKLPDFKVTRSYLEAYFSMRQI